MVADYGFHQTVQSLRRDLLLNAAQELTEQSGWTSVTMAKVADLAGVSRQTVYNELGTKQGLAEQLTLRELDRFMEVVRTALGQHTDVVKGIHAACLGIFEIAKSSVLVRTIVGSLPGDHDTEFFRLVTVESGEIVAGASMVVKESLLTNYDGLPFNDYELDVAVDTIVRLMLSAITRPPDKSAREIADDITWLVSIALDGAAARRQTLDD